MQEYELRQNSFITGAIGAGNLLKHYKSTISRNSTIQYFEQGYRKIIEDNITLERKVEDYKKRITGSTWKYHVSSETPVSYIDSIPLKTIYRKRYVIQEDEYEIHVTFRSDRVSIEVEFPTNVSDKSVLDSIAHRLLTIQYGKWDSYEFLMNASIYLMNKKIAFQTPYDLTWNSLTWDTLIQNPHAISWKADGVRMLYVTCKYGVFLYTGRREVIPISNEQKQLTIYDGELIGSKLYVFDCIFHNDIDLREENLLNRRSYISLDIVLKNTFITEVEIKDIIVPTSREEFFSATNSIIQKWNTLNPDGIIFTPVYENYSHPVYKWKPPEMLTVDFYIREDGRLGVVDKYGIIYPEELKPYNGLDRGIIAEFKVSLDGTTEMIRKREDKVSPNYITVYNNIMSLLRDPIEVKDIIGNGFKLMRKYHNRVKRSIYDYISLYGYKSLTDVGSGKFSDASSWRKAGLRDVYAVEPYEKHYMEGLERLRDMGYTGEDILSIKYPYSKDTLYPKDMLYDIEQDKFTIRLYKESAQEWNITHESDVLTFFNSITFIEPNELQRIVREVNPKLVIIMFIDGNILKSIIPVDNELLKIDLLDSNRIYIHLKDSSTVQGQEENLIYPMTIIRAMESIGYDTLFYRTINGEKLLGDIEHKYTQSQKLLIFRNSNMPDEVTKNIKFYSPVINTPWGLLRRHKYNNLPIDYIIPQVSWNLLDVKGKIVWSPFAVTGRKRPKGNVVIDNYGIVESVYLIDPILGEKKIW